jgi:hypothetical protein
MMKAFKESHEKNVERLAVDRRWLLEKPIPYISNDNFSQEGIFDYWDGQLSGHAHVKSTYPDVVRMWRQFHG